MIKNYLLSAFFFFGAVSAIAADDNTVNVLYLDGTSHVALMSKVDKIEIASDKVNVVTTDGGTTAHKISDIDRIELTSTATGIHSTPTADAHNITVRSAGYTIMAEGLADGTVMEVYAANGALVGKTTAKGGKAVLDAAGLGAGVYVVKAGDQSVKMVKR